MTTVAGFFDPPHRCQFDYGATTRSSGCSWTAATTGADASTGGRVRVTPDYVHGLVDRTEETDPATPGWSIPDVDRAMARLGVPFENRSGQGWSAVVTALDAGCFVIVQGDSDQFSNATCSGDFNGDHCIGVSPATRLYNGRRQRWIHDSICRTGRWEYESVIRAYGSKLNAGIRFGVFTTRVPKPTSTVTVTLRYGGIKLTPRQVKRIDVPSGQRANVRARPTTSSTRVTTIADGGSFTAYQRTKTGQLLAGSRVWYGNAAGTRWLHVTAF